jgi:hypothetical protein
MREAPGAERHALTMNTAATDEMALLIRAQSMNRQMVVSS